MPQQIKCSVYLPVKASRTLSTERLETNWTTQKFTRRCFLFCTGGPFLVQPFRRFHLGFQLNIQLRRHDKIKQQEDATRIMPHSRIEWSRDSDNAKRTTGRDRTVKSSPTESISSVYGVNVDFTAPTAESLSRSWEMDPLKHPALGSPNDVDWKEFETVASWCVPWREFRVEHGSRGTEITICALIIAVAMPIPPETRNVTQFPI